MIWWDFSNFEFIVFFTFMVLFIVFAIAAIVSLILLNVRTRQYESKIFNERNTTRIYILNMRNNSVEFFDRNNIKKKRTSDLASFYQRFHANDVEKVKGWIFSICMNNKNVSEYLEADMVLGKNKQYTHFTILKLLKYNDDSGLLFIESNIMKYITPKNFVPKKSKIPTGVVTKEVMADLVNNAKNADGYLFGIRFVSLARRIVFDAPEEDYMLYVVKNEVYPFLKAPFHTRQLLENNEKELFLLDLTLKTKDEALQLASSILKEIKKSISIHSFDDSISASISIVSNGMFFHDFDTLFDRAELATVDISEKGKDIVFYERNSLYAVKTETSKFNAQIAHLINDSSAIRYLYRPIIEASSGKTYGYLSNTKLYDSPFASLLEAGRYATRINKNKELMAVTAKHVISNFASEVADKRSSLFMTISILGIDSLRDIVADNKYADKINLVLVLYEEEISELIKETKNINKVYDVLSNSGFKLGLLLRDGNLSLDSSFYSCFDYFIFDESLTKEMKRSNRSRLKVHGLIENLYKYKKPIIASSLEGWTSIELSIKTGINYISSETISPSSDMLLPVDKKKSMKIAQMAAKYK